LKKNFCIFLLLSIFFTGELLSQKRYGLIIGSNYKGNKSGISELNLCEADADYMESQIEKVGNFDNVKVLLGKDVTKVNIEREIRSIGAKATNDDVVFLFFAGHGFYQADASAKNGMRNFIVCYDRPHLSDDELNEYLKSIKSPKTVLVLDCCFSGGIAKKGKMTRGNGDIPIPEGSQGVVKQGNDDFYFQNKAIISSADDNQTAIEVGGTINHGIFTYQFGRAMESADLNNDKVVTALEAFFKTRDEVIKMARDNDHEQVPQVSGDASGIFLAGKNKPEPKPDPIKPDPIKPDPVKPDPIKPNPIPVIPEPKPDPVKPDPIKPPVTPEEPAAVSVSDNGDLLIKTSIIRDRRYGLTNLSPEAMIKNRNRKGDRAIKVLLDEKEFPFEIKSVESEAWGANAFKKGKVYNLLLKRAPAGVHKVTVKADDYPEYVTTFAVLPDKENLLEISISMTGFGAIQGQVFYKTLDNPIKNHPIYMPTIKSATGLRKINTDDKGNFWFTNLVPGEYEIRASFAENLELNNSMIIVKEGEITKVQVILNVILPGTKTKY
jgi:hypothetical protein